MAEADIETPDGSGAPTVAQESGSLAAPLGRAQPGGARRRALLQGIREPDQRGKTRPTDETLEWLADRLATDREFLEYGVAGPAERLENAVRCAELLNESGQYEDALQAFRRARDQAEPAVAPSLSLRLRLGEA